MTPKFISVKASPIRRTEHLQGIHGDLNQPPNTEFIEIMAPVFSKDAWRCVWHMIQIEDRCYLELRSYIDRWHQAERNYYKTKGLIPMNSTANYAKKKLYSEMILVDTGSGEHLPVGL
ncbi:hypothetical protein FCM35_KLT17451 [Carex littledalei]|uniref:Uncharacterized protein n=1 Tax=Carex littledalei TaxID=544730 RepID=A0A833RRI5_9POAL|nr:hypothetical protein FCM35_KLT17451 [Carex littledalei]